MARPRQPTVEYRSYELPVDFPLQVLSGPEWRISPEPSQRLHFHNCFEIGLCLSDSGFIQFGESRIPFHEGDVFCVARNVPHTTWSSPGTFSLWSYLHLDPAVILGRNAINLFPEVSVIGQLLSECSLLISKEKDPWISRLIGDIMDEAGQKEPCWEISVRGLCQTLFARLYRHHVRQRGENAGKHDVRHSLSLSPALDYMYENYMLSFSQDDLARLCGMSPTHFRRLFHAQTGINSLAFLHQVRILKSCDLLRTSEDTIVNIASQVGYSSLSCFNRHFLDIMGVTPSEWRRLPCDSRKPSLINYNGWERAETTEEIAARNEADSKR
ncbi:MAG: helix-turn-helix domain-containing protein [Clostridia bacterium]|nr:helix-turn-helix domain-containing protein [Clostridia bacterium]